MLSIVKNLLGIGCIVSSVYLSLNVNIQPVLGGVFHLPSLFLVTGSLIGLSIVLMDVVDMKRFALFMATFLYDKERVQVETSEKSLEELVDIYMQGGGQDLKEQVTTKKLPRIWNIVATKLSINVPIADIKDILEFQIHRVIACVDQDIATLKQIAAVAPAVGMFGSVLGLIRLLADLKDFESLGTNMSLALITTLYGIFIGNIILVPLIRIVEKRKTNYIKNHTNLLYWLEHVEAKKPSFYMKKRLRDLDVKSV